MKEKIKNSISVLFFLFFLLSHSYCGIVEIKDYVTSGK